MALTGTTYTRNDRREILRELGIEILTGEACAYSMRLLCDLNEDGVKLINNTFGMQIRIQHDPLREDYAIGMMRRHNSKVNGKFSVASIMLSHTMIDELVLFGLVDKHLSKGEVFVHATPKEDLQSYTYPVMWGGTDEEYRTEWLGENDGDDFRHRYWEWRLYRIYEAQPRRGSMNVHAMTGRAP